MKKSTIVALALSIDCPNIFPVEKGVSPNEIFVKFVGKWLLRLSPNDDSHKFQFSAQHDWLSVALQTKYKILAGRLFCGLHFKLKSRTIPGDSFQSVIRNETVGIFIKGQTKMANEMGFLLAFLNIRQTFLLL